MKPIFARFLLLLPAVILCLITCKSPVNKVQKEPVNSWIKEMTIEQLQQGYKEGKFTIEGVVKVYLDRIAEIDKNGPRLNSIIEINPDALDIAKEMDKELASGKVTGALFGVPIILKDNIDTHDRMATTAGATAVSYTHLTLPTNR